MRCKCYHVGRTYRIGPCLFHRVKGGREDRPCAVFCQVTCAYDPCAVQVDTILLVKGVAERAMREIESVGVVGRVSNTRDIGRQSSVVDDAILQGMLMTSPEETSELQPLFTAIRSCSIILWHVSCMTHSSMRVI